MDINQLFQFAIPIETVIKPVNALDGTFDKYKSCNRTTVKESMDNLGIPVTFQVVSDASGSMKYIPLMDVGVGEPQTIDRMAYQHPIDLTKDQNWAIPLYIGAISVVGLFMLARL